IINMISQARISGVLNEFLLAKGSVEEDPLSIIDRPGGFNSSPYLGLGYLNRLRLILRDFCR
ncbi:MAG: hypothetical protein KAS38_21775, partial [Anaerolineales bacterium]|nr:hypothetical protein [Anaerolineales bacterium]